MEIGMSYLTITSYNPLGNVCSTTLVSVSVRIQKPEYQELQCLRAREDRYPNLRRERQFLIPLPLLTWVFKLIDDAYPYW